MRIVPFERLPEPMQSRIRRCLLGATPWTSQPTPELRRMQDALLAARPDIGRWTVAQFVPIFGFLATMLLAISGSGLPTLGAVLALTAAVLSVGIAVPRRLRRAGFAPQELRLLM